MARISALALALNISADSLLFDEDERGPQSQTLRLKLEAVDQFTPEEQEHSQRSSKAHFSDITPTSLHGTGELTQLLPVS